MYSGFITPRRVVKRVGIHQRLDMAAYKMIHPYLPPGDFPGLKDILHFEGYNGPDGLKSKSGLKPKAKDDPGLSHIYDPVTDTGQVPEYVATHYAALVEQLKQNDLIRAAFEAAWLAHFIGDGLTPAHHFPLEEKITAAAIGDGQTSDTSKITASVRKNWAIWGPKGHMSTHQYFEMGIAFALVIFPIRPEFSEHELARAGQLGPVEYFKSEARAVSALGLYDRFYRQGWTNELAVTIKNRLAPQTARTIGTIWLLALLEAGRELATGAQSSATPAAAAEAGPVAR